jgi:serine/threonine-protein kinase RsbW
MAVQVVTLTVPAEPEFARSVRMLAANLAVVCGLSIDEVEDVRMAAEEGYVYAAQTLDDDVSIVFTISDESIIIDFTLGDVPVSGSIFEEDSFEYARLILAAVCDEMYFSDDRHHLMLVKKTGVADDQ